MRFLIDAYNLMHKTGHIGGTRAGASLESCRTAFLDWLVVSRTRRPCGELRVVFDGQRGPGPSAESLHRGVRVLFSHQETADDRIETILSCESAVKLVVVSNDGRLHESARRAGAAGWSCEAFMDWLIAEEEARITDAAAPDSKPPLSKHEESELLAIFETKAKATEFRRKPR